MIWQVVFIYNQPYFFFPPIPKEPELFAAPHLEKVKCNLCLQCKEEAEKENYLFTFGGLIQKPSLGKKSRVDFWKALGSS